MVGVTAPNVTITLKLGDKTYTSSVVDLVRLSIGEARAIKRATGMTIADWRDTFRRIDREDPDLLIGLAYLMRTRAGEPVDWSDLDHMSSTELMAAFEATNDDTPAAAENPPEPVQDTPDASPSVGVTPEPVPV
jgi:hypothetical protein